MKFGKLPDISGVNFKLPPDAPGTTRLLSGLEKREVPPRLFIGCTGWSMKEWVGRVYPKGTKAKDYLKAYSGTGDDGLYFEIEQSEDDSCAVSNGKHPSIEPSQERPCTDEPKIL